MTRLAAALGALKRGNATLHLAVLGSSSLAYVAGNEPGGAGAEPARCESRGLTSG